MFIKFEFQNDFLKYSNISNFTIWSSINYQNCNILFRSRPSFIGHLRPSADFRIRLSSFRLPDPNPNDLLIKQKPDENDENIPNLLRTYSEPSKSSPPKRTHKRDLSSDKSLTRGGTYYMFGLPPCHFVLIQCVPDYPAVRVAVDCWEVFPLVYKVLSMSTVGEGVE